MMIVAGAQIGAVKSAMPPPIAAAVVHTSHGRRERCDIDKAIAKMNISAILSNRNWHIYAVKIVIMAAMRAVKCEFLTCEFHKICSPLCCV